MDQAQGFEAWAIVELFGHQKIAGRVSEQPMAGTMFLKVDVPETDRSAAYSRFFGAGAIYGITPCTEDQARAYLTRGWGFSHPDFAAKALPAAVHAGAGVEDRPDVEGPDFGMDDDDDDDGPF